MHLNDAFECSFGLRVGIYTKPIFKHSVTQGERDLKVFKSINS